MKKLFPIILLLLALTMAQASNESIITAVYSKVSNGYQRPKAADGFPKREYYALANGVFSPGVSADPSIDRVKFPQIAGLTAQLLALRNYHLAQDAKQAQFLLVITWGKTIPFNDSISRDRAREFFTAMNDLTALRSGQTPYNNAPGHGQTPSGRLNTIPGPTERGKDGTVDVQKMLAVQAEGDAGLALTQMSMSDDMRRQADQNNAQMLGYVEEINRLNNPTQFGGAGTAFHELIDDIENERYFFVISAYDFPTAVKTGQRKLLWVTRVSIQAQGNRFNETAPYMLAKASKYFGEDSGRLIRQFDREGKVTLGELQVVGVVPDSKISAPPEDKK
jgi:hypothetical protein